MIMSEMKMPQEHEPNFLQNIYVNKRNTVRDPY